MSTNAKPLVTVFVITPGDVPVRLSAAQAPATLASLPPDVRRRYASPRPLRRPPRRPPQPGDGAASPA